MRPIHTLFLAPAILALAACGPTPEPAADADAGIPPVAPTTPSEVAETAAVEQRAAFAMLSPTEGNDTSGELTFELVDGNVHITGQVSGLSAGGEHGFHVHEHGDCSAPDATSAGGHFNPHGVDHGRAGENAHHVGDSDNLVANDEGVAEVDRWLHGATIGDGAATDIVGKGVIVHADADDYVTQPTGGAGDRLACGVIELR